jgi:hypothetical protein
MDAIHDDGAAPAGRAPRGARAGPGNGGGRTVSGVLAKPRSQATWSRWRTAHAERCFRVMRGQGHERRG